MRKLYLSIIIILFSLPSMAQNSTFQPFSALLQYCPEINVTSQNPLNLSCDPNDTCFAISAELPDIRQTINGPNAYLVNEIDYSGNFGFNIPNSTQVLVDIDDRFSNAISLPFPFCFYGETYNQVVIGANGRISFDTNLSGQFDEWQISTGLPSNSSAHTRASIYGLYHDMDPSISYSNKSIEYAIIDDAPCRKLVVTYRDIPHYDCNGLRSTFQIVLYENTNAIEVYVKGKPYCTSWQNGRTIIGLQNWDRNQAVTVPGHNYSQNQSIVEKAWRFIPNGPSLLAGPVELLDHNNTVVQSISNPTGNNGTLNVNFNNVCANSNLGFPQHFKIRAEYQACSGNNIEVSDTITIIKDNEIDEPSVTSPIEYCQGDIADPIVVIPDSNFTINWYDNNQSQINGPVIPNTNTVGTTTYYVSQTNDTCESNLVPIEVIIHEKHEIDETEELCVSDLPFTWHGETWDASTTPGTYTHTASYTTVNGCDSIYNLELIINDIIEITETEELCVSDLPFTWGSTNWDANTAPGTYTEVDSFVSANGCDSIRILELTIHPEYDVDETEELCVSDLPFTWHGETWDASTAPGTYTHTASYTTVNGCDSIYNLELTIHPEFEIDETEVICISSLPFTWHGETWDASTTPGTYTHTASYTTVNGCDSIYNLELIINDIIEITETEELCVSDLPFTWGSTNWDANTAPGTYTEVDSFVSANGCDSIRILELTIHPEYDVDETEELCVSDLPFTWHGETWDASTAPGTYTHTASYTTVNGCDSIYNLELTIHPEFEIDETEVICISSLPFTWHGETWDASTTPGTYTHTASYTTVNGCDSIYNLELIINDIIEITETEELCVSDLPFTWGSTNWDANTAPGTYTEVDSFVSANGCDSIRILELTIHPEYDVDETEELCVSDLPFTWHGETWDASTAPGTYTHTASYTTVNGCDSIYNLELTIHPEFEIDETEVICISSLPFTWHGETWDASTTPGTYTHTASYTTVNGCDSIYNLELIINDIIEITETEELCVSDLPFTWGSTNWDANTAPGTYTEVDSFVSANGCDSIRILELTIHPEYDVDETEELCVSDLPFTWHGETWDASTAPGTYTHTASYTTVNGCDSIYNLELTIHPEFEIDETEVICISSLPFTWHGETWDASTTPGTYTHTASYTTVNGCDSIYNLELIINETYDIVIDKKVCIDGFPFIWEGETIYQEGNGVAQKTFVTSSGCDSIVTLNVSTYPEAYEIDLYYEDCDVVHFDGEDYYQSISFTDTLYNIAGCDSVFRHIEIFIHPEPLYEQEHLEACDSIVFNNNTYYESTIIFDTIHNSFGCDSIITEVIIDIEHFRLTLSSSIDSLIEGDIVHLYTNGNMSYENYRWTPIDYFEDQTAYSQAFIAKESMDIWVYGESINGCVDSANLKLPYEPIDPNVFMPNAFSPNGDGINDEFGPTFNTKRGYEIEEFSIYNRYGQRVFYNTGKNKKWDGTFNGKRADVGTYIYILKVRFRNGEVFNSSGDFHLIR